MRKIKFTAALLLTVVFALPARSAPTEKAETPPAASKSDKRTAQGLRAWFGGHEQKAEEIFSQITRENSPDPVPYHALAILLSDRRGDYSRITELYNRHKALSPESGDAYGAVLPILGEYARKGCVQAQLLLARAQDWGLAAAPDGIHPMLWLRRAADGGYAQAQWELGLLYETGEQVEKDVGRAIGLYSKAAAQDDAFAMKFLAVLYLNGNNPAYRETAFELLKRADRANLPEAQLLLAQLYQKGISVKKDSQKAVQWYKKAAQNGSSEAMNILGWRFENGEGVPKSAAEAVKCYKAAAERGERNALFRLGVLHYTGKHVAANHALAFEYFKKAAEFGDVTAWYNVAWLNKTGDGTAQNFQEAKTWFERAALAGNSRAQVNLGVMYANGEGFPVDFEEACFWFELSKLCGNEDAQQGLDFVAPQLDEAAKDRARRRAQRTFKRMRRQRDEQP